MMAWVTDVPNGINGRVTPLTFRFLAAMTGSLGIGGNLNKWTDDDMAVATRMIAFYKQIRATVQDGKLYRLGSPMGSNVSAMEYISEDNRQIALFGIGAAITLLTGKSIWFSGTRQVLIGMAAAALTYGLGRLLGTAIGG